MQAIAKLSAWVWVSLAILSMPASRSVADDAPMAAQTARGVVFHDKNANRKLDSGEPPIPGVRVSNGQQVVVTDDQGRYQLPVSDDAIVFVIKPRGWRTPFDDVKLARFYYIHKPKGSPTLKYPGLKPTGPLPESIDFPLYPQDEPDRYQVILFGDTQTRNQREIDFVAHDVIEELIGSKALFGFTLGDVAFDNLNTYKALNRAIALIGVPWFNVIGNHDSNYDASNREQANETFESIYGPSYYSFDYGSVHYVLLNDIDPLYDENRKYVDFRGGYGPKQLEFLENDLKHVPNEHLVVLLMHVPVIKSTPMHDVEALFRIIEKRSRCVSFSAHSHMQEYMLVGPEHGWKGKEPHRHFNLSTVCGSWWSGALDERGIPHTTQMDGTPNGYTFLNIDGANYTLDFKPAGRERSYQIDVDAPDVVKNLMEEPAFVYANFFIGTDRSALRMKIDDGDWMAMEKTLEADGKYKRSYEKELSMLEGKVPVPFRKLPAPAPNPHLWKLAVPRNLPVGSHMIQIEATDHWGRQFTANRVIRAIP